MVVQALMSAQRKLLSSGFDDSPQSKSKAGARWIVVKVSHLNNASSYILILFRLI